MKKLSREGPLGTRTLYSPLQDSDFEYLFWRSKDSQVSSDLKLPLVFMTRLQIWSRSFKKYRLNKLSLTFDFLSPNPSPYYINTLKNTININFLRKERLYTKLKYSRSPAYDIVSGGAAALLAGFLGFLVSEKFGILSNSLI